MPGILGVVGFIAWHLRFADACLVHPGEGGMPFVACQAI
jgi:hypothetical protein